MSLAKSILFCSAVLAFVANSSAVTINWSAVGNAGNANDPADGDFRTAGIQNFGAVPYPYRIGTYDVTNSQYVEFLNAKDAGGTNILGLYNASMGTDPTGGISFAAGSLPGSKYSVISGNGNHPVNFVSWYDVIRFTNWINNGQSSSDTETGAYTLGAIGAGGIPVNPPLTHNAGALIWLPTENEWYKAAYYNPTTSSYFQYPTSSNTTPISSPPTALPNHGSFYPGGGGITDVGAYTGTMSPYGAFDMGGNVWQWNETFNLFFGAAERGYRGGEYAFVSDSLLSSWHNGTSPAVEYSGRGFRLASVAVPEPSTLALAAFGFIALAWRWRRKLA